MIFLTITSSILFVAVLVLLFKLKFYKIGVTFGIITFIYIFLSLSLFTILHKKNIFSEKKIVKIEKGMSFTDILKKLKNEKIITQEYSFKLSAYLMGKQSDLKAGKYQFEPGISNYGIIKKLENCDYVIESITIPEGLTIDQIAKILKNPLDINEEKFIALCKDEDFIKKLGFEYSSLEGFLFPDTYLIAWGKTEEEIIQILTDQFKSLYNELAKNSKMTEKRNQLEIVTMASLIEGEAMLDDEKPIIAGVFYNRLEKRIKLQADPTIQYIIPDSPRRLLNDDLKIDSPYNTYLYYGLPPGPINNPGKESLKSALYPEETDYLYFVAKGDGSHTFSKTIREHINAKRRFDRIRREIRREQKNAEKN